MAGKKIRNEPDIRYSDESHAKFNERFEPQQRQPANDRLTGPWIAHDQVPDVLKAFQRNRDPDIRAQLRDMDKTEAQRRGGDTGRESTMVGRDKPAFESRPPEDISRPVDRAAFNERWLVEQRDAVLARADIKHSQPEHAPERQLNKPREPSR